MRLTWTRSSVFEKRVSVELCPLKRSGRCTRHSSRKVVAVRARVAMERVLSFWWRTASLLFRPSSSRKTAVAVGGESDREEGEQESILRMEAQPPRLTEYEQYRREGIGPRRDELLYLFKERQMGQEPVRV